MEQNNTGLLSTLTSIFFTGIAWISAKDYQIVFAIMASIVAIVSGGFAIRYYYYATKKLK